MPEDQEGVQETGKGPATKYLPNGFGEYEPTDAIMDWLNENLSQTIRQGAKERKGHLSQESLLQDQANTVFH